MISEKDLENLFEIAKSAMFETFNSDEGSFSDNEIIIMKEVIKDGQITQCEVEFESEYWDIIDPDYENKLYYEIWNQTVNEDTLICSLLFVINKDSESIEDAEIHINWAFTSLIK